VRKGRGGLVGCALKNVRGANKKTFWGNIGRETRVKVRGGGGDESMQGGWAWKKNEMS